MTKAESYKIWRTEETDRIRQKPVAECHEYELRFAYGHLCVVCNMRGQDYSYTASDRCICRDCSEKHKGDGRAAGKVVVELLVPPAYATASLDDLPVKTRNRLKSWPDKCPLVGIAGIQGSGKTWATWAAAKNLAQTGRKARIEDGMEIRERWIGSMTERRGSIIESLCNTRWLILDALTDGDATEGWTQAVMQILNARFRNQSPTLVTTMHDSKTIARNWGTAIMSRLSQFHWTVLPPIDKRAANKAEAAD